MSVDKGRSGNNATSVRSLMRHEDTAAVAEEAAARPGDPLWRGVAAGRGVSSSAVSDLSHTPALRTTPLKEGTRMAEAGPGKGGGSCTADGADGRR